MPVGVIGISVALTTFTELAHLAAENNDKKFITKLREKIYKILRLVIPASFGMYILSPEIVKIILLGGKFSIKDAQLTSQVLQMSLLGLFAYTISPLLIRAFFAKKNTFFPLVATGVSFLANVILLFILPKIFGITGLGLANSITGIINFGLLIFYLKHILKKNFFPLAALAKVIMLTLIMTALILISTNFMPSQEGFLNLFLYLSLNTLIGILIYFGGEKILTKNTQKDRI